MHECRTCNKQFQSAEALTSHQKAMHTSSSQATAPKNSTKKYISGAIIVVILLILGYGAATIISPASQADTALAQCIASSGAKFYGAFWCPHCQDQKDLFGRAAKHLPYIECSNSDRTQRKVCADAGIDGYPTWVFADGSRGYVMTKPELAQRTGCTYTGI